MPPAVAENQQLTTQQQQLLGLVIELRTHDNELVRFKEKYFPDGVDTITQDVTLTKGEEILFRWIRDVLPNEPYWKNNNKFNEKNIEDMFWDNDKDSLKSKSSIEKIQLLIFVGYNAIEQLALDSQKDVALNLQQEFERICNSLLPQQQKLDQVDQLNLQQTAINAAFLAPQQPLDTILQTDVNLQRIYDKVKDHPYALKLLTVHHDEQTQKILSSPFILKITESANRVKDADAKEQLLRGIAATYSSLGEVGTAKVYLAPIEAEITTNQSIHSNNEAAGVERSRLITQLWKSAQEDEKDTTLDSFQQQLERRSLIEYVIDEEQAEKQHSLLLPFLRRRKESQQTKKSRILGQTAQQLKNPLLAGAGAVGVSGAVGLITQGIAGGAGAATFSLGGAIALGAAGSIFGPVGTIIGAVTGGLSVGLGSLAWQPYGGASAAQMVGGFEAKLFGVDLHINPFAGGGSTPSLGVGANLSSVASNTVPATAANAARTAQSLLPTSQAVGVTAKAGVNGLSSFLNMLSQASSPFAGTGPAALVTLAPPAAAAILTAVAVSVMYSTYLTPNGISPSESKYVYITKTAKPSGPFGNEVLVDGQTVVYTLGLKPKRNEAGNPYKISITKIEDTMSFISKGSPDKTLAAPQTVLDGLKITLPTEQTSVSYPLTFNKSFEDTRVNNTLLITFTVEGETGTQTASVTNVVIFGNPPTVACWPATGLIVQGPWQSGTYGGGQYPATHENVDAIDISGTMGSSIVTSFSGTADYYSIKLDSGLGGSSGIYGNHIVLHTDQGFELLFAHMSSFADNHQAGETNVPIEAGQTIGYMGNTSSGTVGIHLHYEYREGSGAIKGKDSVSSLEAILPEPLQYSAAWVVTGRQRADQGVCSSSSSSSEAVVATAGCFDFVNKTQDWDMETEVPLYKKEMESMLSDSRIKSLLCKNDHRIQLLRYSSNLADKGCQIASPGSGAAEELSDSQIAVCTKMFDQASLFGTSTMWHEPGHIIQDLYSPNKSATLNWKTYYPNLGTANYIETYPLTKSYSEDFAEAWGFCNRSRITGDNIFRGVDLNGKYTQNCQNITNLLNGLTDSSTYF